MLPFWRFFLLLSLTSFLQDLLLPSSHGLAETPGPGCICFPFRSGFLGLDLYLHSLHPARGLHVVCMAAFLLSFSSSLPSFPLVFLLLFVIKQGEWQSLGEHTCRMTSPWAHPLYKISIELSATQITRFFLKKLLFLLSKQQEATIKHRKYGQAFLPIKGLPR